jgi:hypothetical protein
MSTFWARFKVLPVVLLKTQVFLKGAVSLGECPLTLRNIELPSLVPDISKDCRAFFLLGQFDANTKTLRSSKTSGTAHPINTASYPVQFLFFTFSVIGYLIEDCTHFLNFLLDNHL